MARLGDLLQRSAFRSGADRTLELPSPSAESGSGAQVFEVTDLLIPAGTDWSTANVVLDRPEMLGLVLAYSLVVELAGPPAAGDVLTFAHTLGSLTGGDSTITLDETYGEGGRYLGGVGVIDGEGAVVTAYFATSAPTTADITVVRARAAFLVI